MAEAFYEPDGDGFRATELTRGPWDPRLQHFGPPAALIARAVERADVGADTPQRVARITYEILRPVPLTTVSVHVDVVRPGKRVSLVQAELADRDGEVFAHARAWRLRVGNVTLPEAARHLASPGPGLPPPDQATEQPFFLPDDVTGYHTATQWRFLEGSFLEPGPSIAWSRSAAALVAGESPTPLQRVLISADSGNGISSVARPADLLYVNTDLTVALHRDPVGEWIGMDARTTMHDNGSGLTRTSLYDDNGPIGTAQQTLFVDEPR